MAVLSLLCILLPCSGTSQPHVIDDFEHLSGWKSVTSHGDASRLTIMHAEGRSGKGMLMDFSFLGHMGSAAAEKRLGILLPDHFQLSFEIRGEADVNNLILRFVDSLDNVWIVIRPNFSFPREWTRFTVRSNQIQYGWGPSGGGVLRRLDRLMIMIDVVEGGAGKVWVDNLTIEPLDDRSQLPPRLSFTSARKGGEPRLTRDGHAVVGWYAASGSERESITCDFQRPVDLGGIVVEWDSLDYATAFEVQRSTDGNRWTTAYAVPRSRGKPSYIPLPEWEERWLRLEMRASSRGKGYGITRIRFKGPEFTFSINDFFGAIAADAPPGHFPRYLLKKQSFWTVVGVAGDSKEALVNEEGMIETDKLGFALEPFLYVDSTLITWNDVRRTQTLAEGDLPVPSVLWEHATGVHLTTTVHASGEPGESVLYVKYLVSNAGPGRRRGRLFVAARPFQVNPPWQTFTIVGGVSRIDSAVWNGVLTVNGKKVVPLTAPTACGIAAFDEGQITEYLRYGNVPASVSARDPRGYASVALQYGFDLEPGGRTEVILLLPFHAASSLPPMPVSAAAAKVMYDSSYGACVEWWRKKVRAVELRLPGPAQDIVSAIRANLAYVLINGDGPGTQPGSRSYERSWIRDGALTSAALLQMGIAEEVRRYIDWYAGYQYPNGMIPAIVEARGPDPTPEHDSHGQFIYMVAQYFRYTHDTTWLQGKWNTVVRTVRFIQSLRAQRKTEQYRTGTPVEQACYGLVPESISHEGYTPRPMHSYWDNFFVLRGLKDAAGIARALGKSDAAIEFTAEETDMRNDLGESLRRTISHRNLEYIPGCVELAEFAALSTTVAVTPCDEAGVLPEPQASRMFDLAYRELEGRMDGSIRWTSYLPYEARFIGANVHLGRRERAYSYLRWVMKDRRPEGWNAWAEIVWHDRDSPSNIGDMPHSWAASDFIRSVRSMLVYERESDETLVVGAGIPPEWLQEGLEVRNLPTYYGPLSYSIRRSNEGDVVADLWGEISIPSGGIVTAFSAVVPQSGSAGTAVRSLPATVVIRRAGSDLK